MEGGEGGEAKQDEHWALAFGFSSGVVADLGKHAMGRGGGGGRGLKSLWEAVSGLE